MEPESSFRNSIGTVDTTGKRIWAYPKKPKGRYYRYRKYVSYLLLSIFPKDRWKSVSFIQYLRTPI